MLGSICKGEEEEEIPLLLSYLNLLILSAILFLEGDSRANQEGRKREGQHWREGIDATKIDEFAQEFSYNCGTVYMTRVTSINMKTRPPLFLCYGFLLNFKA